MRAGVCAFKKHSQSLVGIISLSRPTPALLSRRGCLWKACTGTVDSGRLFYGRLCAERGNSSCCSACPCPHLPPPHTSSTPPPPPLSTCPGSTPLHSPTHLYQSDLAEGEFSCNTLCVDAAVVGFGFSRLLTSSNNSLMELFCLFNKETTNLKQG